MGLQGTGARNLSLRISEAAYAKLVQDTPRSESPSGYARRLLEGVLLSDKLPSLLSEDRRAPRPQSIDWSPVIDQLLRIEVYLAETQRETLRAVAVADAWTRYRLLPQGDAVLDQKARNAGEQAVRDWERSVGR